MISSIYKIINIKTGKVYIGSAKDIKQRWRDHRYQLRHNKHGCKYLQRSWNKYGEENFKFEIIEIINDPKDLIVREQYWIDHYQSYKPENGYNGNIKANSRLGTKHSDKTKILMSISQKGKKLSPEHKANLSAYKSTPEMKIKIGEETRKRWLDPETRAMMISNMKGKTKSPKHCAKISAFKSGQKHTPETRERMSELTKEYWKDPIARSNMIMGQTGRKVSPEGKIRMSEIIKNRWNNPEIRNRMIDSIRKKLNDPEYKRKASERTKNQWENPKFRAKMIEGHKNRKLNAEKKEKPIMIRRIR